jgi:hypothetical protein
MPVVRGCDGKAVPIITSYLSFGTLKLLSCKNYPVLLGIFCLYKTTGVSPILSFKTFFRAVSGASKLCLWFPALPPGKAIRPYNRLGLGYSNKFLRLQIVD